MKPHQSSKSTRKATKVKHVNKKRLLKSFGLLLGLLLIVVFGLFLIQQYNSTYPTESIAGKAYSDLTAEQKQGYWACYKEKGCGVLLSKAQETKNYAAYRTCSKDCHAQALAQKQEDFYCTDSDGINYTNKGIVTSNFYPQGKEDYCLDINGKNYLFEGKCVNNKAQWVQKNCKEVGSYECEGGRCEEEYWEGLDDYFIKNKGELDCNKLENQKFCDEFNSAKKYYGFGTYKLQNGDFVIIDPFIFKWTTSEPPDPYPIFKIFWVDGEGKVRFISAVYSSDGFQGIYVDNDNSQEFTFSNNCSEFVSKCELEGGRKHFVKETVVVFSPARFSTNQRT